MNEREARAHYNYLMTLCIRREEAFGPLALAFIQGHDLDHLGLEAEESLNLYMATADAFPAEPRRYTYKLLCLRNALTASERVQHPDSALRTHLEQEIAKTSAELQIYTDATKATRRKGQVNRSDKLRVLVETDLPEYFLSIAQKRAATYYRQKYGLSKESRMGLNFKGPTRKFDPNNPNVHKDLAGACPPFMSSRTTAFHLSLPFDLKISRQPDDALEAGMRIWYATESYSFPLQYERGTLCSWYDGEVVDLPLGDSRLLYVSVSRVKERELGSVKRSVRGDVPLEVGLPLAFLESTDALGPFIQIGCNMKVWFDATEVSLLTQGAPDLHEYGLQGATGLLTGMYATEQTGAYAAVPTPSPTASLSFNFINMHLLLQPGVDSAFVPFNTPIFSVYPVLNHQLVEFQDLSTME